MLTQKELDYIRTFKQTNLHRFREIETFKINQTAVGHRGIGTVVQIVIVNIPFLVGIGYVLRKHLQPD